MLTVPWAWNPSQQLSIAATFRSNAASAVLVGLLRWAPSNRTDPPTTALFSLSSPSQRRADRYRPSGEGPPRRSSSTCSRVASRAEPGPSTRAPESSSAPLIRVPTRMTGPRDRQSKSRRLPSMTAFDARIPRKCVPVRSSWRVFAPYRFTRWSKTQSRSRTGHPRTLWERSSSPTIRARVRRSAADGPGSPSSVPSSRSRRTTARTTRSARSARSTRRPSAKASRISCSTTVNSRVVTARPSPDRRAPSRAGRGRGRLGVARIEAASGPFARFGPA